MNIIPQRAIPYIVLVGAFLYNLNIGILNSYGNLSIYLTSYLRYKGNDVTYRSVSFIYELTVITLGLSMLLGNYVQKKLGERLTILISCIGIFLSFYLSSIYTHSYYLLCIFMGITYAIGYGISFTIPLSCAYKHFTNNRGLISGIVISAISLSPFLYCPLQTLIINKDNILPIQSGNDSKEMYFKDINVLNRVPYVLFIQSIIFLILATLGGLMATIGTINDSIDGENIAILDNTNKNGNFGDNNTSLDVEKGNNYRNLGENTESGLFKSLKKKKKKKKGSDILNMDDYYSDLYKGKNFIFFIFYAPLNFFSNLINQLKQRKGYYFNKKCTEDILFFVLWLSIVLFNGYINYIIMYWKIIGVTYTQIEDTIITLNGSLINSMTNIAGRLIWGIIYDKINMNITILLLGFFISVACFTLPAVAHIYPLYAICCGIFYFCIGGSLVTIPVITLKKYGEKYFSLNMSILYTSRIANTFLCSLVVKYFYNWLKLRCLSSVFGILSIISTIILYGITV
ncbi:monocarboxylate transporter, putative [Plasmodium berghei]|uniref:Monocarboxylate transporter, putative n=2 Tax=Plasmodium berghei TaxID=5821 RepID=A0A509AL74_PLABA|nr:monocarboxylate transporter, putative [Plasmodium berghei ANKA]CXI35182.1 monocarboxylate transporter, putative [Plasmodium berghei]SCM21481.1 monocarboxylate transporter, putative [Plasmodium berghei]SCN24689.1 monocarboxylate transporter, putative [Plasmodium berghei]SCO59835.1 monocarboxylate transporter, putative [Plasmodium berghei]SCO61129.1 monocarboxylate transporter, putative [Plasmodium berghei]|eukprot:XP_034421244.1 monocarboxylate transporter, putative [Plasmodium berghei ANKA]